ncbi:MAG: GumC domain-containing protein [Pirellulales bacterium]
MFGATGLAILALGYFVSRQVPAKYTASAVVYERRPAAAAPSENAQPGRQPLAGDAEAIRQEVLAEANLRRAIAEMKLDSGTQPSELAARFREDLCVEVSDASNQGTRRLTIASTGDNAEQAATLVNLLAQYYVGGRNRSAETASNRAEGDYRAARQAAEMARRDRAKAETELDAFLDLHFAELTAAPSADFSRPPAPEGNPRETSAPLPASGPALTATSVAPPLGRTQANEVKAKLDALIARRAELLVRMTPEHPEVQDLEAKIAELQQELATMGPYGKPSGPAESSPSKDIAAPSRVDAVPAEPALAAQHAEARRLYQTRKEVRDQAEESYDRLARAERVAWENRVVRSKPDLRVVEFARTPTRPDRPTRMLVTALAVVLAVFAGAGMAFAAGRGEATFASLAEVEAALQVPVVGVISGTSNRPARKRECQ